MKFDRFAFVLRQRKPWESLDLGVALARQWRGPVYAAWCLTYVPYAVLMALLLDSHPVYAFFGLWWAKPVFDRVLLFVFSRAVFGEPPQWRESLRAFRQLISSTRLWADLTYLRLSPFRAFTLPVVQLEEQHGVARRKRVQALGRDTGGFAAWLCVSCLCFVILIGGVVAAVLWAAIPVDTDFGDASFWRDTPVLTKKAMFFLAWVIGESVIEPIFVAGCFALYLNRRSDLEGWDLELALKQLGERLRLSQSVPVALLVSCIAAACILSGTASEVRADPVTESTVVSPAPPVVGVGLEPGPTQPGARASSLDPATVAREVMKDPAFGQETADTTWRYIPAPDQPATADGWFTKLMRRIVNFISGLLDAVAKVSRIGVYAVWGLAIVFVIGLLYTYRDALIPQRKAKWRAPSMLFGMDVRAESLPDDVTLAANALIAQGNAAAALGLLYRATLVTLIHRERIEFAPGDTEAGCERRVNGKIDVSAYAYFVELLLNWRQSAYAHRDIPRDILEQLSARWGALFRMDPGAVQRAAR